MSPSEEFRLRPVGIQRCQVCGEPIGPLYSNDPTVTELDPAVCVVRCFACAATEEAQAITKEASDA